MKLLAATLFIVMTFFLVQPLSVSHKENDCTKKCCPESKKEKNDCPKNCNPFFACMYCQYVVTKTIAIKISTTTLFIKHAFPLSSVTHKGYLNQCWHPPND
jgi:hypothetical protein